MTGFRRGRWIAIISVVVTLGATLAVGASAFASQSAARCGPVPSGSAVHNPSAHDSGWRTGAFQAARCRAWRRMHHDHHQILTRTGRG